MAKVRVNFQMEESLKEWCISQAESYGISMSGFLNIAVTQYKQQAEAMNVMKDMGSLIEKMEQLQNSVKDAE